MRRLLILGGTRDAIELARRVIADRAGQVHVISSLAGATEDPVLPPGEVRIGGFGGVDALRQYLKSERIGLLIDATHPFAARMQENAAQACAAAQVRRCRLLRAPWRRREDDKWIEVGDTAEAASAVKGSGGRNFFLALGWRDLHAFSGIPRCWFLVRGVSELREPISLEKWHYIWARGPFKIEAEIELLREFQIDAVVSRQSGGEGAQAKIDAARQLGIPVVMIRRPPLPAPPIVATVDDALQWLGLQLGEQTALSALAESRLTGAV